MPKYPPKILLLLSAVLLLLAASGSQIIFSILYDPSASSYIFLPGGHWTHTITTSGYKQSSIRQSDQTTASLLTTNRLTDFQTQCPSGQGMCTIFAHDKLWALIYRLDLIQYIGKEVEPGQANTITNRIHRINTLSPQRAYPYIFAVLMGPNMQTSTQKDSDLTAIMSQNSITIGEQGIRMTCDTAKVQAIKSLSGAAFVQAVSSRDTKYRNPCSDYRLPHLLAFDYYHYLRDYTKAIDYYKVAAMHDDVPKIALSMPSILARQYGILIPGK